MGHSLKNSIQRTKYLAIWLKTGVVAEYLSFKAPNNLAPNYIRAKFTMSSDIYNAGTRNANHNLILPKVRTSMAKMLSGFQQRGAGMSSQKTSKRPSSIPWALLPVLENFHHSFSRPDWLPLGLRRCIDFGLLRYKYFESKTVILLGFVLQKRFARCPANSRIRKILLDLHVQKQLFVNLDTPYVQFLKRRGNAKVRFTRVTTQTEV